MDATMGLRALLVEDNEADALLVVRHLTRAGFCLDWRRVDSEADYTAALPERWDVIVSDYNMPGFDAHRALELLHQRRSDCPFIVVSGSIGEETAVDLLRQGATDYLLKDRIGRLGSAVARALEGRRRRYAQSAAEQALARTEERMRFALEAAQVGTWEADIEAETMAWSPLMEALHGLAPGAFAGRMDALFQLIHVDDHDAVRSELQRASRDRDGSALLYRTTWPDGSVHWIRATGRTVYDASGTRPRAAGVAMDVTEHRELEEQYRHAQKMEAVGLLAGGVAHDFNNVLTAIRGYSDLLGEALGEDHPRQKDVRHIREAANRAAGLTRQLLAFSRRQILQPRVINLRDVVHGIEPMLRRLIGADVQIELHGTRVGNIQADQGQVEQVIMNLAINARDAMPGGGVIRLEVADVVLDEDYVRRHKGGAPGPHVMLAVADTGTGMDAATRKRIFEPFFTTKEHGKGTGLGLSTVFGIVKQSGGNIWVYSEPGLGTTFKVYFPRVGAPVQQAETPRATERLFGTETVLVVEDDDTLGGLVRTILERYGYRVLATNRPEAALLVAQAEPRLDLLVSDVVMPGLTGGELYRRLVVGRPDLRVLFMSGYTDATMAASGVLPAEAPYLQKPFSPHDLARAVRQALG
ncbi:MAG: response regulator [Vicinamibacterales bacterium]